MTVRWVGAAIILFSCAASGFLLAYESKREEKMLLQIIGVIDCMMCELQYRLTSLPDLLEKAAYGTQKPLKTVLLSASDLLNQQLVPDATTCISESVASSDRIPRSACLLLKELGKSLGKYDLPGQITSLQSVREQCQQELAKQSANSENRLRSYRTLGICAGIALTIMLL